MRQSDDEDGDGDDDLDNDISNFERYEDDNSASIDEAEKFKKVFKLKKYDKLDDLGVVVNKQG